MNNKINSPPLYGKPSVNLSSSINTGQDTTDFIKTLENTTNNNQISFSTFLTSYNNYYGYKTPTHHIVMADWLENLYKSKNRHGILLSFRGSGKSTIVGLFCCYLLLNNPTLRIMVVSADNMLASKMVKMVKRLIETYTPLEALKPDKKISWSSESFSVNGSPHLRDNSMLCIGILSNATGSRADIIIYDDVEVPNNCDSEEKRISLRERLDDYNFILTPNGMQLFIGTPHTFNSIYRN